MTPGQAWSQTWLAMDGYAEFESRAPMLTFKGKSENLAGLINFEDGKIDFYLDLNTLDTGIELRNRHMRESYLETVKFPFAEFTGRLETTFDFSSEGSQPARATGNFTIHGVQREILVEGTLRKEENGIRLKASWTVLLEDHNIARPRVVFYELSDSQIVSIDILLKEHTE